MKEEIRKKHYDRRLKLHPLKKLKSDRLIREHLEHFDLFQEAETVLYYVSFKNEVDTHKMIKDSLESKIVLVPKIKKGEKGVMEICRLRRWDELKKSELGILEACHSASTPHDPCVVDLIFVPGLAFDQRGYRIGFGGGYYDRMLACAKGVKVGLAYDWQIIDNVPAQKHDIPLDFIITDQGIIRCFNP